MVNATFSRKTVTVLSQRTETTQNDQRNYYRRFTDDSLVQISRSSIRPSLWNLCFCPIVFGIFFRKLKTQTKRTKAEGLFAIAGPFNRLGQSTCKKKTVFSNLQTLTSRKAKPAFIQKTRLPQKIIKTALTASVSTAKKRSWVKSTVCRAEDSRVYTTGVLVRRRVAWPHRTPNRRDRKEGKKNQMSMWPMASELHTFDLWHVWSTLSEMKRAHIRMRGRKLEFSCLTSFDQPRHNIENLSAPLSV